MLLNSFFGCLVDRCVFVFVSELVGVQVWEVLFFIVLLLDRDIRVLIFCFIVFWIIQENLLGFQIIYVCM